MPALERASRGSPEEDSACFMRDARSPASTALTGIRDAGAYGRMLGLYQTERHHGRPALAPTST
jgi:hypothetical protein